MLPSRYFIDLTQPEIAGASSSDNPLVILPAGQSSSSTGRICRPAHRHLRVERDRPRGRRAHGRARAAGGRRSASRRMHAPYRGHHHAHARHLYAGDRRDLRVDGPPRCHKYLLILNWQRGATSRRSRSRRIVAPPRSQHDGAHRAGLLRRGRALRQDLQRPSPMAARIEALARARLSVPTSSISSRIDYSSDPHARPQDGQAAPYAQLSAGAHRHSLDRADRLVRQPAARGPPTKGARMLIGHRGRDRQGGERDFSPARRGPGVAPQRSSTCGRLS